MPDSPGTLSLKECAERLDVHYMTVYRYVRLGMLPAFKVGTEWRVEVEDLEAYEAYKAGPSSTESRDAPWAERLQSRLLAGDEKGSWKVVEASLAAGLDPHQVYTDVVGPAMREIGAQWKHGTTSIAAEHRATAISTRVVGRLSGRFATRGRTKGRVVIGTPPGEKHALAVSMAADVIRGAGFDVIDLGCDLPVESFVEAIVDGSPVVAVAVSVTGSGSLVEAASLVAAIRAATSSPIMIGGAAVTSEGQARELGADFFADSGPAAAALARSFVSR